MINLVKTGLIVSAKGRSAVIMSNIGEFYKVNTTGKKVKIGDEFTGTVMISKPFYRNLAAVASLLFFMLIGSYIYTYNTPVATVLVNINPSIQLKTNRYSRIVSFTALNNDGNKVLKGIKIKNKTLDDGLYLIIMQSQKDNFINDKYIESGKKIMVDITSMNNKHFDLSKSEQYISTSGLNAEINNSGVKKQISNKSNRAKAVAPENVPQNVPHIDSNKPASNDIKDNPLKKHTGSNSSDSKKNPTGNSVNKSKNIHKTKDNGTFKTKENKKH